MLFSHSAQRVRHAKLLADADGRGVFDFAMPRNGAGSLGGGVVVNAVSRSLPKQQAAVLFQVADQVDAFHIVTLRRP